MLIQLVRHLMSSRAEEMVVDLVEIEERCTNLPAKSEVIGDRPRGLEV